VFFTVDRKVTAKQVKPPPLYLRWPHLKANQVQGLSLREIGGGFAKHHRAPSVRSACYAIAKPCTMVQKMQNIKKLRGHRVAVYCGMTYSSTKFAINMTALWACVYTSSSSVVLIKAIT
jgi:PH-interacting protein